MAQFQVNKPSRLNLDIGRKYLRPDESFYMINNNTRNKSAIGKSTPMSGNYAACEMTLPSGENYSIGSYRSEITNEVYSWTYNSNNVHHIIRLNGSGECEIVYSTECLNLSANPKHAITQERAKLIVEKSNCANRHGKYLQWVDGYNENINFLDVEASVATNYFTTSFFDRCNTNPCDFISLCVPQPVGCLNAEFVPLPLEQAGWTNNVIDIGFKFMYKFEYYDGRMSEWSDWSTLVFQDTKGCFDTSGAGFSRCIKLRVPIGNPMVSRIHIAFNKSEYDEGGNNIWYVTEVVEKYKKYNSTNQYWYERDLSEVVSSTYSDTDCAFDYYFCNDKQCKVVDPVEVSRVYNPMPRYPQVLLPIKDSIGVLNYVQGNCMIDKAQTDKMNISLNCPTNIIECEPEIVTVTVRAIIYNDVFHRNQFIYRLEGTAINEADDKTKTAYFGGILNTIPSVASPETTFDQSFNGGTRNFIATVEGMEVWAEMEQWHAFEFFNTPQPAGVLAGMTDPDIRAGRIVDSNNGGFLYQEAKLKVRKGTKGFVRLVSHKAESNEQDTSTFVMGLIDIRDYAGYEHLTIDNTSEEIYFDTCNGAVELFQAFVIKDNAIANTVAFHGYVTDGNGKPVEGAVVVPYPDGAEDLADSSITDHNGFYHVKVTSASSPSMTLQVRAEVNCGNFVSIQDATIQGVVGANTHHDIKIDNDTWKDDFITNVEMQVKDCDGNGVSGVRVALSGSRYDITDSQGYARWKIRNYSTRNRSVRGVVLDYRGCFTLNCSEDCNPCMPDSIGATQQCYINTPTLTLSPATINISSVVLNNKGLKAGGNYPLAVLLQSTCGSKISAAYELPALRIPKTQERGYLGFCSFNYDASGMELPFDGQLKILRGTNLNPFELQWVVDRIDRTGDNKIKLTIQSLNDYNEKFFFKTNTVYQYLKGDRIEFIRNGDGKIFTTAKYGLLNYLTLSPFHDELISGEEEAPADFFNQLLIEDDGRLDDLSEGAIIELQRPRSCTIEPAYFEICATIPVVNGQLQYPIGTFTTFDTYFVNRVITYQNEDDKSVALPATTFEHHSPSDFWGDHLTDTGKVHFVNLFENEKRYERNISIASPTQYNYFGDLVKTFAAPEQGAIISAGIKDGKIILVIGENDTFLTQTADELVRVGSDGIIRALPADAIIGEPQPKVSGQYGCKYESIGGIYFGDGYAWFPDVKAGHYILHDYNNAQIAGMDKEGNTTMYAYTSKRFQEVENLNRGVTDYLNHYRFAAGFNKEAQTLSCTIKTLRQSGVNNEKAPFLKKNDTVIYYPKRDEYLTFHSATPESYSQIDIFDGFGSAQIMFYNSVPYIVPVIPESYNEFFGIACSWLVGFAINKDATKIKIPLCLEIESSQMWYAPKDGIRIESDADFVSEIPPIKVVKQERKYNCEFLANVNSRGGLYNGQQAKDYSISVLLSRDDTNGLRYNTVDRAKQISYGEIDMILAKYIYSESSGLNASEQ